MEHSGAKWEQRYQSNYFSTSLERLCDLDQDDGDDNEENWTESMYKESHLLVSQPQNTHLTDLPQFSISSVKCTH